MPTNPNINIPCVILSGGKSSRMGRDKSLLEFDSMPLALYMYHKLQDVFSEVYLSVKDREKYDFDANFLIESTPIFSSLCGILHALNTLKSTHIFVISVDTPLISAPTIHALLDAPSADIVYARTPYKSHYLISRWSQSCVLPIQNALDTQNYKLQNMIQSLKSLPIDFEDDLEFSNLNTPQDYDKIRKLYE